MRKFFLLLLVFVMVIALVVISCAQPAPAPKPAPTPSPTPVQPLELKYATQNSPASWIHPNAYLPWAEMVGKETKGRVKCTVYPAETLGKGAQFYDLVRSGVADLAFGIPTVTPGQFPITEIFSLPFMGFPNAEVTGRIQWEIYEKFPELQAEYSKVKVLAMPSTDPFFIVNSKRSIKTMDDIQGMKLRTSGGRSAEAMAAVGSVPALIPMPELYLAMEKGIVDGACIPGEPIMGQVPVDKCKYTTTGLSLFTVPFWIAMNLDKWNSLSKDDQAAIMKISGRWGSEWYSRVTWDDSTKEAMKILKEKGSEIYQVPREEQQKWVAIVKPTQQKYITDLEAKGIPAQKIFSEISNLVNQYSK